MSRIKEVWNFWKKIEPIPFYLFVLICIGLFIFGIINGNLRLVGWE